MSQHVTVTIAGQEFRLACQDGDAERMVSLALDLDAQLETTAARHEGLAPRAVAVLTALSLTRKLRAAEARSRHLADRCAALEREREARALEGEREDEAVLAAVTAAADTVERMTAMLTGELKAAAAVAKGREAEPELEPVLADDERPRRGDGALLFRPRREG